jgi:hypothetical protein
MARQRSKKASPFYVSNRVRELAPFGTPLPANMPQSMVAPVWNTNLTRSFEEEITDIRPGQGKDSWVGTVHESLGRNGTTVKVWWHSSAVCWRYA